MSYSLRSTTTITRQYCRVSDLVQVQSEFTLSIEKGEKISDYSRETNEQLSTHFLGTL